MYLVPPWALFSSVRSQMGWAPGELQDVAFWLVRGAAALV